MTTRAAAATAAAAKEEDLYGQVHPNETPELVKTSLEELDAELAKIPADDKKGWTQAKAKCPNLTDQDHKLKFLRCEVFNVDLAAIRLTKYWDKRIELFGPTKAFLPLTLDGALKDDEVALSFGFMRLLPGVKDPVGRGIVFLDPSCQDKTKYERESMARACWYVLHAALEDNVDAQKKGIVILGYPHHAQFKQFDRPLVKMNLQAIQGCMPIRVACFQICHPPSFFAIIFPILKLFMAERMRKRIKVHSGSQEKVLARLEMYGLTKDKLPTDLGGDISLDHDGWIEERRAAGL